MIFIRAELGEGLLRLSVDGHADHAEEGRVCAAVSAVTQTTLLGLEALARQFPAHIEITIKETSPCS